MSCACAACTEPATHTDVTTQPTNTCTSDSAQRKVTPEDLAKLKEKLFMYMRDLLHSCTTEGAVASVTLINEFTAHHIQQVLDNCDKIRTMKDVVEYVEVWRKEHCGAILCAINETFGDVDVSNLTLPDAAIPQESDILDFDELGINDSTTLCQLSESDLQEIDMHMEENDISGCENKSVSSIINHFFRT